MASSTANNANSKSLRTSQTTSPPTPSSGSHHGPKLPKFLTKQSRDRSKSVNDSTSTIASTSSSVSMSPVAEGSSPAAASNTGKHRSDRRGSKLKGVLKELKDDRIGQISQGERHTGNGEREHDVGDESMEETPVIIEPVLAPARPRTRSERPLSASVSSSDSHPAVSYYPSNHSAGSTQRLSDMGTRLSGWFSHTFSTSSTDLSLPALLSNSAQMSASPKSKSPALGLLTAARHGKGYLDKGLRYVLDSDATPDKCTDPIWLLGVQHPGYEPPPPSPPPVSSPPSGNGRRSSLDIRRSSSFRASLSSSRGAASSPEPSTLSLSTSQSGKHSKEAGVHWPPVFYLDFTSRVWLTYRSHFAPIRDQSLAALEVEASGQLQSQSVSASPRRWNWPVGGEKGWTSDSGWGCMLRTGQSLLANALIHQHLGRDWRKPPHPIHTADYATYVQILTWFFDSPDPGCPFSVHRMALAGKDLGKDVGQWFGPSTAAGAIKALTHAFPEAGLGVSVATDGVVYETDVLAASNISPYMYRHKHNKSPSHSRAGTSSPSSRRKSAVPQHMRNATSLDAQNAGGIWGQRPVLVLVGVRLGIQGVNPIYYDALKEIYKFPQSVGIAGGRPSSSYYFVGAQADSLFYLDPHHARPAVPFKQPPRTSGTGSNGNAPDSPGSSFRDVHYQNYSGRMQQSPSGSSYASHQQTRRVSPSPSPHQHTASLSGQSLSGASTNETNDLDLLQDFYVSAYSPHDLSTFHCEKVRKMPLSGLDPSMLIGFLCRDERDWRDLRHRMTEMGKKYKAAIFAIQDEPPSWPSDSDDMGLESVSDVDIDIEGPADAFELADPEERDDDVFEEPASDDQSANAKRDSGGASSGGRQSEDVMTEEDPVDPVTPGPSSASHTQAFEQAASKREHERDHKIDMSYRSPDEDLLGDDEEWVETSDSLGGMGTPQAHEKSHFASAVPMGSAPSNASTATTASYVSASSSYSYNNSNSDLARTVAAVNLNGGAGRSGSASASRNGSRNGSASRDQERSKEREREKTKESKGKRGESSRSSKIKSSKSASSGSKREASQPQEYFPFPVVDDREPEDLMDFHELSSQSESSQAGGTQHTRERTGTASSRTPIASVAMSNSTSGGGSRLRNAKARDGGRTQSGGVRGIVTSDLEDSSDF